MPNSIFLIICTLKTKPNIQPTLAAWHILEFQKIWSCYSAGQASLSLLDVDKKVEKDNNDEGVGFDGMWKD